MKNTNFDIIRYANVWEDADLLTENLDVRQGENVLSIASAGDNAFALLANGPAEVVAVDVSQVQLYLTELKAIAIKMLNLPSCEAFLGFRDTDKRLKIYQDLRGYLSENAREYWDENQEIIESGIINCGKFERYLQFFAKRVLPLIHSKKKVAKLLEPKSDADQKEFYYNEWNTTRWRIFFKLFFSKRIMGWAGRDPAFLAQVEKNVGQNILEKAEAHLTSTAAQTNSILHYCLTGSFGDRRPYYLRQENFYRIKANIDRLTLVCGYVQDVEPKKGGFQKFNLSNIFEYMDVSLFHSVVNELDALAGKQAKFAYWNLMVERNLATVIPLSNENKTKGIDKGFFYQDFKVNQKSIA